MTAQISDSFIYQNREYNLAFADPEIKLTPKKFGIKTLASTSACWRGFKRTFEIEDDNLILQSFDINDNNQRGDKKINNVLPSKNNPEDSLFNKTYNNVKLKIKYTGKLCIARDFIWKHYTHGGFHPAWKYETVFELAFFKGVLIHEKDISGELKEKREQLKPSKRSDMNF